MKTKKIIALILSALMLCIATPALAADIEQIANPQIATVKFVQLNSAYTNIRISGGAATCSGYAKAKSNSYTVKATLRLQKQSGTSWTTISSWSGSGKGITGVTFSKTKSGLSTGQYRTSLYVSVYNSNNKFIESTTVNSDSNIVK